MAKQKKKQKHYSYLFFRILGSITTPLVLLLVLFTFLFIKRELANQQNYYDLQSTSMLQTLNIRFQGLVNNPEEILSPGTLTKEVEKLEAELELPRIFVIDPTTEKSVLQRKSAKGEVVEADETTLSHMQTALTKKREGQDYFSVSDRKNKRFIGYVPIYDKIQKKIFVVITAFPVLTLQEALAESYTIGWIAAILMMFTTLFISITLTARIVRPIQAINKACRKMLSGSLGLQVSVKTGDELEVLGTNFNRMSRTMLLMQRHASESNPLTKLPGNPKIMAEMEKRLKANEKFTFFHCDIDHFKAFNDAYGLSRGDDVLRETGELMTKALAEFARKDEREADNFLGHQGGDDFVMILSPWNATKIAELVCKKFDELLKTFYNAEALQKGYFEVEDTREQSMSGESKVKKFPLMSISLAGISTVRHDYKKHEEILEKAILIKKKAKQMPYSSFVIDE